MVNFLLASDDSLNSLSHTRLYLISLIKDAYIMISYTFGQTGH